MLFFYFWNIEEWSEVKRKFSVFFLIILNLFAFLRNFFELSCGLSENAAKMRTDSDKISEKIQRNFSARDLYIFFLVMET